MSSRGTVAASATGGKDTGEPGFPGFATSLLPRVISQFLKQRPGATISLQPRSNERVQEWIMAQQYDVGFAETPAEHPAIESKSV